MVTERTSAHGLIRLFVHHPTASNLLMAAMIAVGLFALTKLNTQFFPTLEIPQITVSISWSGASAEDVEENILDAVEPELRFLDDIDEVRSVAREGGGVITLEFKAGADMQKAQSDVEQAVDGVTTLPEDSEEPVISRITFFEPVAKISVSGPYSEMELKAFAKQIRDGLLDAGIDKVTLGGARDEEIWVRVRERELRRLGLSLSDIASRIREETQDLPSGILEGEVEMQLRSRADRKTPEAISEIEVRSGATGEKIRLDEIANISTEFERDQSIGQQSDGQAIELNVQRALSADTLKTMNVLTAYMDEVHTRLPKDLKVSVYDVRGRFVQQRLGILLKNGLQGLALVLIILFIFLDARVAFWVAAGIPVALMATLAVMYLSGQTINMVSMFALIMMLGIIVDDAIVVGEHTATRQAKGDSRIEAAERGATRMLLPVVAATLTTQAAFFPIFLIRDQIGDIMSAIPLVVFAVLIASLIECFLILPGHLRYGFGKINREGSRFRKAFDGMLNRFRDGTFQKIVKTSYDWRYTTVAFMVAMLILCIGLIAGGRVKFHFFPSPESENITAAIVFGAGTPRGEQRDALNRIEQALYTAEDKLGGDKEPLVVNAFTTLGVSGRSRGENLAKVEVQLTPSEERSLPTRNVVKAWREYLPKIPGVEKVVITEQRGGPPGRDIDIRLQDAPVADLKVAALELRNALSSFPGVNAVNDDLPYGRQELILEVTPRGSALGFTSESVGVQVRNAFEGAVATRFARGDEEITVRVKRLQEVPGPYALRQLYLRSPDGNRVPLNEIVEMREKSGFSIIQRVDGRRSVAVTGSIDADVTSVPEVLAKLDEAVLPGLADKYKLQYEFKGRAEERTKSFADLRLGAMLSLIIIYIILAWVFGSYGKPFAVMAIIPFGIVGAILGHMVMGYPLTIISMIGLLGLSGILVNDSIILATQVVRRLGDGNTLEEAAVGASQDRLRAVLLTSLTTIGGLTPLLFETSRQAQFLIPMAVTMVFGLAAATILVLILVPSLIGIGGDFSRMIRSVLGWFGFTPARKSA
ncbi:MAG: efflux RND transporter permease subunit [Hyphomicrobiaceae bacterium]|nr:efflux RND transporter permease subunit [Hyphomicrobiaceae bacterium]